MNILPLVIGCIAIFSFLSFSFFKESQAVSILERRVSASFRIENGLQNRMAARQFSQHCIKQKSAAKGSKSSYYSIRSILPPIEESKLNIGVLFDGSLLDVQNHSIYLTALNLLTFLYKERFWEEAGGKGWQKRILDEMIQKGKKIGGEKAFFELYPEDKVLQELYYKMLKGTNQYELEKEKKGIPPLEDFFRISSDPKSSAICFCFASEFLLRAAFGEKFAKEIVQQEREKSLKEDKRYFFSKEDLQMMFSSDPAHSQFYSQLESHLSFHSKIPRKEKIAGKDRETGLVFTKDLF